MLKDLVDIDGLPVGINPDHVMSVDTITVRGQRVARVIMSDNLFYLIPEPTTKVINHLNRED